MSGIKKILGIIMTAAMLMGIVSVAATFSSFADAVANDADFPSAVEGAATVAVGDVSGNNGETVSVPVSVENNSGMNSGTFTFKYDADVIEPVLNDRGNVTVDKGIITDMVTGPVVNGKIKVVWQTGSVDRNITENGVMFTLKFKIIGKKGAKSSIAFTDFANDPIIVSTDEGYEVVAGKFGYKAGSVSVVSNGYIDIENDAEFPIADGGAQISIADVGAQTGETVDIPILAENNIGFNCGTFTFKYNSDIIEPVLNSKGNAEIKKGFITNTLSGPVVHRDDGLDMITITWQTPSSNSNISDNGVMFSLVFKVVGKEGSKTKIAFTDFANDPIVYATDDGSKVVADNFGFKAGTVTVHNHELTHFDAVYPTCGEAGNIEYYQCNICGRYFDADKNGVNPEDVFLAAFEHSYVHFDEVPAIYGKDGMKEHYRCEHCGKLLDANSNEIDDISQLIIPKIAPPDNSGDANGDAKITANDVLLIRKSIAGQKVDIYDAAADVNHDGKVTANDALLIRRFIAGQPVNF